MWAMSEEDVIRILELAKKSKESMEELAKRASAIY